MYMKLKVLIHRLKITKISMFIKMDLGLFKIGGYLDVGFFKIGG